MSERKIAAVYIRVSTDDQTELSPDSQLEVIRAYAEKNGYLIPDEFVFVDEGISGRKVKNRPAFKQVVGVCKNPEHPVDTLLLWKFSRFARNQEESIVYKAMLRKSGVDVISVSEPIIEGPFGSLIERIIEWMDEYYSIQLAGEVKRSMTVNATRGKRQTITPFGYRLGPDGGPFMVPEPQEAEIIQEVFAAYTAGTPVWQIVKDLNARGVLTHRGSKIENRTVDYWLQNPAYIGKNRWTPTGKIRRDFRNADTLIVTGDHEPLVTQAVFDAAQELIRRNSEKYRPKARPSFELKDWMGGVVRCADCGNTLVFQKQGRYQYFICNGYVRAKCNVRQSITVDALHEAILEKLRNDLNSSRPLNFSIVETSTGAGMERKTLRQRSEALDRKLRRVREAYLAGVESLEEYRNYREEIAAQQEALQQQIRELDARRDPAAADACLRERLRETLETLEAPDISKEQKNDAIRGLVENCTWKKSTSTLTITYRVYI